MNRLTIAQWNQAIRMLICGTSNPQVAKFFRVQTFTITQWWYRYQSTGTADDRPRAGRPKSLSDRHRRRIIRQRILNPTLAAAETGRPFRIHSSSYSVLAEGRFTMPKAFSQSNFATQSPPKTLTLSTRRRFKDRRRLATSSLFLRMQILSLFGWQKLIHGREHQRLAAKNVQEFDRFCSKSLMIWCGISGYSKTRPILTLDNIDASRYITEVLQAEVLRFLQQNSDVLTYPAHRSCTAHRQCTDGIKNIRSKLVFTWKIQMCFL